MADSYENQDPEKLQGKYKAVVVSCILGIGSLVSWHSLLTVGDYYYKIFPDYHPSRVLTFVYQPFALGTIMILSYHESKNNNPKRNLIGYIIFRYIHILAHCIGFDNKRKRWDRTLHQCTIVALFGFADAAVRGGMIGDLSLMCPEILQSFTAGMSLAGALTSAFRLITKAALEKSHDGLRKGAMIFLAISTFIEFLCVMLYAYVFPKLPIVKYYRRKAASEGSKTVSADLAVAGIQIQSDLTDEDSKNQRLRNKELLLQNIDYAMNLSLIYVLTFSILRGFLYENTGQHGMGAWYALVLIAMCNWCDLIGRYATLVKWLKVENRRGLTLAVLSRLLLVPAFYFTTKYGDKGWMIMLVSVLGFSNEHLTVCIITIAPKGYKGPEKNALGNLLMTFMLGGALAGVSLGWFWLIGVTEKYSFRGGFSC